MKEEAPIEAELDESETLRMAQALAQIVPLEGWAVVKELQERAANDIGRMHLRDKDMSKDYARGYLAATEAVAQRVDSILARAKEIQGARAEERGEFFASRLGSGSLAE